MSEAREWPEPTVPLTEVERIWRSVFYPPDEMPVSATDEQAEAQQIGKPPTRKQDKRSRRLTLDGEKVRISYDALPDSLTSGFQDKSPDEQLQAIRTYTTDTGTRHIAKGAKKKSRYPALLRERIRPDIPEGMSPETFDEAAKKMLSIYVRIILNAGEEPDLDSLSGLVGQYAEDTQKISDLGFTKKPYTIALGRSPADCAKAMAHYRERGVTIPQIRSAFVWKPNPEAMLDRYLAWLPDALQKYQGPYLQRYVVGQLVYAAAASEDPSQVDRRVNEYLQKVHQLEGMRTDLPGLSQSIIGRLAVGNRFPKGPAMKFSTSPKGGRKTPPAKSGVGQRPKQVQFNYGRQNAALHDACSGFSDHGEPVFFQPFSDDASTKIWLMRCEPWPYTLDALENEDLKLAAQPVEKVANLQGKEVYITEREKLALSLFALGAGDKDVYNYAIPERALQRLMYTKLELPYAHRRQTTLARAAAFVACRSFLAPESIDFVLNDEDVEDLGRVVYRMLVGRQRSSDQQGALHNRSYAENFRFFREMYAAGRDDSLLVTVAHATGALSLQDVKF